MPGSDTDNSSEAPPRHFAAADMTTMLRDPYTEFVRADRADALERNAYRGLPVDFVSDKWDVWGRVPFPRFVGWVHELSGCNTVCDIAAVTGSFTTGLRVLQHLAEAGIVDIDANGGLTWLQLAAIRPTAPRAQVASWLEDVLSPVEVGRFGQCAVEPKSSMKRGLRVARDVPDQAGELLFLGDCDLVSVVVASELPNAVTAIDADALALERLQRAQQEFRLTNLQVVEHDLALEIPAELRNRFSAAVIDPIDNGWGIDLWLRRVFEALGGELNERVYISIDVERIGRRLVALQGFMAQQGFALEELSRNFHEWPLPWTETEPHTAHLREQCEALGISTDVLAGTRIFTDLLVFTRRIDRWPLLPQDHVDVRRGI
jgi:Predicted methyltransferases